jgi:hypothetical protein
VLCAVAGGILLSNGCGPANEENLGGTKSEVVAPKADTPQYKSFGDMMLKKSQEAAKGKGAKTAPPASKKE